LADLGGSVDVQVGGTAISTSFPVALLLAIAAFLVLHLLLRLIGWLWTWRSRARLRSRARRRTKGDAAITRTLVALAAGAGSTARLEVRRARQALGNTPQTLLLAAEAERLAGRPEAAEEMYRALALRDDAKFLGLRGLLRAAMERGDWDAALRLAREAEAAQPGAAWLREERARLAVRTRDWREALALATPEMPRAPLALAAAEQERDPGRAGDLERQAFEADGAFTPAALAHARRLFAEGNARRARSVLEDAWAKAPHPDLAPLYLGNENDPLMRMKSVEALVRRNPTHPESRHLLARTALDAKLTGRARNAIDSLMREGKADRRAYLMLAELEEAEHGDSPDARAAQARWLREAATATPEPAWRCGNCGTVHPTWRAVCDACETVGEVTWTSQGTAGRPAPLRVAAARA
jgi:HemY protein